VQTGGISARIINSSIMEPLLSTELEFTRQLAQQFPAHPPVAVGIGDDGAVLRNFGGSDTVVVTDMLLDGVHFDLTRTPPELAGRKAIAVNLSDLAAMACRPTAAFVSIAAPKSVESEPFLAQLYDGIRSVADEFDVSVAGGDTNSWDGPFAINVCMTGTPFHEHAILRSGAQPGDSLVVTGPLGGSLQSRRHLTFDPRLRVAELLSGKFLIHAMMDLSDGLALDLNRMMESSGTGAVLTAAEIPIHPDVPTSLPAPDRLQAALGDGEDFELLLALSPDDVQQAVDLADDEHEFPIAVIGTVVESVGCRIKDEAGIIRDLAATGWQHFG